MLYDADRQTVEPGVASSPKAPTASVQLPTRINLFDLSPWLKRFVKLRSFQFLLILPNLALFEVFLIAGLFGSPIGNRNIMIVFVWILWWFILITIMVPFASRIWCVLCPFPFFGEGLQRGALVKVRSGKTGGLRNKMFGLNKRWPRALSNIWIQNFGFLTLATFCALLVTRPIVSVIVLGGLFVLATGLAIVYQRRIFCNYICPVSGFLGLYSMSSTVGLRAINPEVCLKCKEKNCATGSERGWACPWFLYMGRLERNNFCGLCMECMKSCPNDNIGLFARSPFSDTVIKGYDEAWKAFIMLALAMVYSIVLLGPWGIVKDWANVSESGDWVGFLLFAAVTWGVCLAVFPAIWGLTTWLGLRLSGSKTVDWKQLFLRYSYVLVPLGLFAWIAFSFPLIMVNGSYIVSVASDPLGQGWDLFGTAHVPWTPIYPEYAVYIQIVLLLTGLGFALKKGYDVGRTLFDDDKQLGLSFAPVAVLCVLVTLGFLTMFSG